MTTTAITKIHANCPHCDAVDAPMSHLEDGREFGPWYCDHCGRAYKGIYRGVDTVLVKDDKERRQIPTLVLLEYPPSDKPLRFLMENHRYVEKGDLEKDNGHSAYYYEEGSCPTNWIGDTCKISHGADPDPHGFLRYVREIDRPDLPENCMDEDAALYKLFPELVNNAPVKP